MRNRKRVTIRDVAAIAGVSTTTVSDALSGHGRLPVTTRERVIAVAGSLGYRPRRSARALRAGRRGQIGLYCPFLADIPGGFYGASYYMQLAMGAAQATQHEGFSLALFPNDIAPEQLSEIDVDGVIVADPLVDDPSVQELSALGTTIVTCERDPTPRARHPGCVRSDHGPAIEELMAHIESAGAHRPALIVAGEESAWSAEVGTSYRRWCTEHELDQLEARVPLTPLPEHSFRAAQELFDRRDAPDAVVCAPDGGVAGVLGALRALDLRVPYDVLVAACVDGPVVRAAQPPITAIDLQPTLVGRRAAELLIGLLAGSVHPGIEEVVPTALIVRASTAKPSPASRQASSRGAGRH